VIKSTSFARGALFATARFPQSTLALLMAGIGGADHVDPPLAANDLATLTNALDAGSNLHF